MMHLIESPKSLGSFESYLQIIIKPYEQTALLASGHVEYKTPMGSAQIIHYLAETHKRSNDEKKQLGDRPTSSTVAWTRHTLLLPYVGRSNCRPGFGHWGGVTRIAGSPD